jgi:hypothetical protein
MNETIVRVVLPSGNHALYSVQPQHLPRESVQQSYQWPSMYGQQLAVRINGDWFKPDLKKKCWIKTPVIQLNCGGPKNAIKNRPRV